MEAWTQLGVELTRDQAAELSGLDLVDVVAQPQSDGWVLVANSRIGVAIGNGWELRVRPKLAVPRLFFLLAYAADPRGWKDESAEFGFEPDLMDAVASGFSWHALRALELGVLRGYVHVDERLITIRGRVRFSDQIARSASLPLPVEVSYDDYTADILENRMIKTATLALLRLPRVPVLARMRLLKVRAVLDEVSLVDRPREAKMPPLTRLNQRYGPSLRLAELILHASSIDAAKGPFAATAFVFDMNKVFEDFVTTAFTESMRRHGGTVRPQVEEFSLDVDSRLRLKPDLSWWVGDHCLAILDAKYKAIDDGIMRHPDAYQMLAYCTAYGLPRGYLVYARDSGQESRTHRIRNANCEIVVAAVDVEKEPEEILAQMQALADSVATREVQLAA